MTVGNGFKACEALEQYVPDLLILDVGLPDISGWDVLDFVRAHPDLRQTAVIMLTGHADAHDIETAANKGADEYLLKPFRPDELRRLVVDTIHGSARMRA
jgi:two-component system KDP operon response regulator KdpE